jgi:hypothetical protein
MRHDLQPPNSLKINPLHPRTGALVRVSNPIRTIHCVSDARKLHYFLQRTRPLSISASLVQLHPLNQCRASLFDSYNSRLHCCKGSPLSWQRCPHGRGSNGCNPISAKSHLGSTRQSDDCRFAKIDGLDWYRIVRKI